MKKLFLAFAVSLLGATIFNPNVAKAVELPGGAAFIDCRKIGTGTYVAPWSFESYNGSPIFVIRTQVQTGVGLPPYANYFFFVPPTFDYENQLVFTSNYGLTIVRLRGEALTPNGSISTNTPDGRIPVNALCPFPLP